MSDVDWPTAIYDQAGQLVDLQYNANSISIVNHLADGANGKRCPKCNTSPMYRTQLVWEENTRRHKNGTMLLTNIARRVAPPGRPARPTRDQVTRPTVSREPFVAAAMAVVLSFCLAPTASQRIGAWLPPLTLPVVTAVVACAALWFAHRRRSQRWKQLEAETDARFDGRMKRYNAALKSSRANYQRWKSSWFCKSCSAIVAEGRTRGGSQRVGADSRSRSRGRGNRP